MPAGRPKQSSGAKQAGNPEPVLAPLYKRLPHGPHGLKREEVQRNQRMRICGAMIESVYQRGYAATSVAHTIGLAGVSRRAFYEHFPNKEACFLHTFSSLAAASRERVSRALLDERGQANRLRAACQAFLQGIADNPRASYLMLVEATDAGPRPSQCLRCSTTAFERIVATGLDTAPNGPTPHPAVRRAILGGIRFVVVRRLREGRHAEIAGLTGDLLDWLGSYRPDGMARLGTLATALPPRQISRQARFLTRNDPRSRAMAALVKLSMERGYMNVADADVARAAAISTEAFHREFAGKHQCLLAILDELAAELHDAIQRATRSDDENWPQAIRKGVQAVLGYCAAHPGLMRLALVDVFDAGQTEHARGLLDGFLSAMTKRIPGPDRAPGLPAEAALGGIWAILASYVQPDRLHALPSLAPHISYLALAPYTGSQAAVEAIEAAKAEARPRRLTAR